MVLSATLSNLKSEYERLGALTASGVDYRQLHRARPRTAFRHLNMDEIEELAGLYVDGETMKELGERFRISRRTVAVHLKKVGVSSRHHKMDTYKVTQCIELYDQGLSLVAVGKQLGIDQATVLRALIAADVPRRPRFGMRRNES